MLVLEPLRGAKTCCCLCRFVPYCSSDVWSGATAKTEQSKESLNPSDPNPSSVLGFFKFCLLFCWVAGGYAFMGSLIIQEVVKDLLSKGLDTARVLLLAGSRSVCALSF